MSVNEQVTSDESPVQRVLDQLERQGCPARVSSTGWQARCPAHDDHVPSLSLREGRNRRALLHCHAGCTLDQVLSALGLDRADLGPTRPASSSAIASASPDRAPHRRTTPTAPTPSGEQHAASVIAQVHDYRDETGALLFQTVRYAPKGFRYRQPCAGGDWIWSLRDVRRIPYRLPELLAADEDSIVFVVEGEKDADALARRGLVATTNPGGAGKWREEYSAHLRSRDVVILPDNDAVGQQHAEQTAKSLHGVASTVKILRLPELPEKGDVSDWMAAGGTTDQLVALAQSTERWLPAGAEGRIPTPAVANDDPWAAAVAAPEFLSGTDPEVAFLEPNLLAPGALTLLFSPRGLGKTHVAHALAVGLARRGKRVLLIDRDNARAEVRRRLGAWCAQGEWNLKVLTREHAPPLTDVSKWADFPFGEYDAVIIDSLDSSTEGVGEQDSSKVSKALAALLDIVRRKDGPAFLVLGNTVKTGAHSRGCGVIEDRADIVYEVRDATKLVPSGRKEWWHELPEAGVGSWADRASRRIKRNSYRLAFIPTKFRVGAEPEPFVLEVRLDTEPWQLTDVTRTLVQESEEAIRAVSQELATRRDEAARALCIEVEKRAHGGERMLADKDAVPFLVDLGLTRKQARGLIVEGAGSRWMIHHQNGDRGKPNALLPLGSQSGGVQGGNEAQDPPLRAGCKQLSISADGDSRDRRESSVPETAATLVDPAVGVSADCAPPAVGEDTCHYCHSADLLRWGEPGIVICRNCHRPEPSPGEAEPGGAPGPDAAVRPKSLDIADPAEAPATLPPVDGREPLPDDCGSDERLLSSGGRHA